MGSFKIEGFGRKFVVLVRISLNYWAPFNSFLWFFLNSINLATKIFERKFSLVFYHPVVKAIFEEYLLNLY